MDALRYVAVLMFSPTPRNKSQWLYFLHKHFHYLYVDKGFPLILFYNNKQVISKALQMEQGDSHS